MTTKRWWAALALALVAMGAAPARAQAEERYWITKVPTLGGTYANARRLNASGEIAGSMQTAPDATGAVYDRGFLFSGGIVTVLGLGGDSSSASDINDLGQVLGSDYSWATGVWNLFLYDHGVYHDLRAAGLSGANDLGAAGHVAGAALDPSDPSGNGHAAVWFGGAVTALRPALLPFGEVWSDARFVNAKGEVVGAFVDSTGVGRTFFYRGGTAQALPFDELFSSEDGRFGPLNENSMVAGLFTDEFGARHIGTWWEGMLIDLGSELAPGLYWSQYRGMNDRNDLFGYTWTDRLLLTHVFYFSWDDQTMHDIGSMGGYMCVHGINNKGDVAGHGRLPGDADYLGQYWSGPNYVYTGGKMYDLNEVIAPGSGLVFARYDGVINDAGQVLVPGTEADGREVPVLFTPFPSTDVALTGTLRADGWYTTNVTPRLTATAVPGIREIRYRVNGGAWVTVAGAAADLPALKQQGTNAIEFYAVDTLGHAETPRTAAVSIDKGGLVVGTRALRFATASEPYAAAVAAAGGKAPYSFQLASGTLPAGLALRADGRISGTPAAAGARTFEVKVTDARKATSRAFLSIEVLEPLVVTTPRFIQGGALTATGGKPPYTWAVDSATPLPSTMGLDFATVLGGIPGPDPVAARFVVTDSYGKKATAEIVFGFVPVSVYLWSGATTVALGAPVALQLAASGGFGASTGYSFRVDGTLPAWLSLDASGLLSGTASELGTFTVSVVASDGSGNVSSPYPLTLTVQ